MDEDPCLDVAPVLTGNHLKVLVTYCQVAAVVLRHGNLHSSLLLCVSHRSGPHSLAGNREGDVDGGSVDGAAIGVLQLLLLLHLEHLVLQQERILPVSAFLALHLKVADVDAADVVLDAVGFEEGGMPIELGFEPVDLKFESEGFFDPVADLPGGGVGLRRSRSLAADGAGGGAGGNDAKRRAGGGSH